MTPLKLVILDRDGTINEDRDDYVKSPDEWVPIPGSLEAIARLNHAGWHTVVATNQSGLARGLFELIGDRYGVELGGVPLVGDSLRDLQAGAAVGCPTHLVRTGKGAKLSDTDVQTMVAQIPGTTVHADLAAFAEHLIQGERAERHALGKSDSGFGHLD